LLDKEHLKVADYKHKDMARNIRIMKHVATIQKEFVKHATIPDWWRQLSVADQKRYISSHPHTSLRPIYPIKMINDVRVRRIRPDAAMDTSYKGEISASKRDLIKLFGMPNFRTKKHGDEWVLAIGSAIVTIYNGSKTAEGEWNWHVGGHHDGAIENLQKVLKKPEDSKI